MVGQLPLEGNIRTAAAFGGGTGPGSSSTLLLPGELVRLRSSVGVAAEQRCRFRGLEVIPGIQDA